MNTLEEGKDQPVLGDTPIPVEGSTDIRLSICIATYQRGNVIRQTLDNICAQLGIKTELIVVDGNSPDNTEEILLGYQKSHPNVHYFREETNSGVDQDFDKAIGYARGDYCWLMTDDDLIEPEAIATILKATKSNPDLVVVDAEVRSGDFSEVLQHSRMFLSQDAHFESIDDDFLKTAGDQLSFIGSVVIRREVWNTRDRESFYGSLFIHAGVILQSPPLQRICVLAKPLIQIRYGNAMWTPRSFEIWMLMWPQLIWSFPRYSDEAKLIVCPAAPWKNSLVLLKHRAKGSYSREIYRKFVIPRSRGWLRLKSWMIACVPAAVANFFAVGYVVVLSRRSRLGLSDLLESPHASVASQWLARALPLPDIVK